LEDEENPSPKDEKMRIMQDQDPQSRETCNSINTVALHSISTVTLHRDREITSVPSRREIPRVPLQKKKERVA
jgi:hypothetical protein